MSTLFAGPVDSGYRRSITPSNAGIGVDGRSPFEVVMDSVVRLQADRARLSSPRTINVLSGLIARAEKTVITADLKSSLIAVWKALLAVVETPAHNQSLEVRRQLLVALAKMLCSPVEMPLCQRQRYWEMLKVYLLVLESIPGYEEALVRIGLRFPQWMDVLNSAVRNGRIQQVTAPSENCGQQVPQHKRTTGPRTVLVG